MPRMGDRLLVGTRGSKLAIAQTNLVLEMLRKIGNGFDFGVVTIKTAGDVSPPEALGAVDGKTAFTGEIERELREGKIDFAVHSMKDLPQVTEGGLAVASTPPRGDPRDALVSAAGLKFMELKGGAQIGTSSARRRAQLLATRSDIEVVDLHGNVETRLRKLETEKLDGVVLAAAGLERLGLTGRISEVFGTGEIVPAPCQGILAVQARSDDGKTLSLLRKIEDPATRAASRCEGAFSAALGGDCDVPLGAFADVSSEGLSAVGVLADPDGSAFVKAAASGDAGSAEEVGKRLAAKVIGSGGDAILKRLGR